LIGEPPIDFVGDGSGGRWWNSVSHDFVVNKAEAPIRTQRGEEGEEHEKQEDDDDDG